MKSTGPPPEVIHRTAADMGFTSCPHCRRTRHRQAATPVMSTVDLPLAHARSQFETTTRAMSGPDSSSNGAGVIGSYRRTRLACYYTCVHRYTLTRIHTHTGDTIRTPAIQLPGSTLGSHGSRYRLAHEQFPILVVHAAT